MSTPVAVYNIIRDAVFPDFAKEFLMPFPHKLLYFAF